MEIIIHSLNCNWSLIVYSLDVSNGVLNFPNEVLFELLLIK